MSFPQVLNHGLCSQAVSTVVFRSPPNHCLGTPLGSKMCSQPAGTPPKKRQWEAQPGFAALDVGYFGSLHLFKFFHGSSMLTSVLLVDSFSCVCMYGCWIPLIHFLVHCVVHLAICSLVDSISKLPRNATNTPHFPLSALGARGQAGGQGGRGS